MTAPTKEPIDPRDAVGADLRKEVKAAIRKARRRLEALPPEVWRYEVSERRVSGS